MKDFTEINDLMISLIENAGAGCTFTDKSKTIIHDIAEYARQMDQYNHFKHKGDTFMEEWRAEETVTAKAVYLHMLYKIANAPTKMHRNMCIILFLPIIDDLINEEDASANKKSESFFDLLGGLI